VLTRIVIAAFWLAALGALVLLIVFVMKLGGMASPGWTTTVAGVVIGVVVQTVVVSLLGLLLIMRGRRAEAQDPEALAKAMIRRIDRFGPSA
jgi:polyisoprenyl-phosphate glycosyltransferase